MVQAPGSAFYDYPRWLNMDTCIHHLPHRSHIKLMNETVVEQLMQLGPKMCSPKFGLHWLLQETTQYYSSGEGFLP